MTHEDVQRMFVIPPSAYSKIKKVADSCFRVNVYETYFIPESVIPRNRLVLSAYIRQNPDGSYEDITKK